VEQMPQMPPPPVARLDTCHTFQKQFGVSDFLKQTLKLCFAHSNFLQFLWTKKIIGWFSLCALVVVWRYVFKRWRDEKERSAEAVLTQHVHMLQKFRNVRKNVAIW